MYLHTFVASMHQLLEYANMIRLFFLHEANRSFCLRTEESPVHRIRVTAKDQRALLPFLLIHVEVSKSS